MALATWQSEGVDARVIRAPEEPTGAAFIFVNERTGDNAIIVAPARPRRSPRATSTTPPPSSASARSS